MSMAAYVIADIDVTDPVVYEDYKKASPAPVAAHGGKFIVRGGAAEVLEGEWKPNRIVVLEFENIEQARKWYDSPEYEKPKALRQSASRGSLIVVDGV
jgi:uncharacterized protein (DUF1330 family)